MDELTHYGLTPDVVDGLLNAEEPTLNRTQKRSTPGNILQLSPSLGSAESCHAHTSSAARWLSSLPRDERYAVKKNGPKRKRRATFGSAGLHLDRSETSPDTFWASINVPVSFVESPSPKRRSPARRHSIGGSRDNFVTSLNQDLPPLVLPVGALHEPGQYGPDPLRSRQSSHDYQTLKWMQEKQPELFPDDETIDTDTIDPEESSHSGAKKQWIEAKSGRRAWGEYELFDDSFGVHPQIVLHVESPNALTPVDSPDTPGSDHMSSSTSSSPGTFTRTPRENSMASRSLRHSIQQLDLGKPAQEIPTIASRDYKGAEEMNEVAPGFHHRRIVIPLKADERFFDLLILAIRRLLQLHVSQQRTLTMHVESLCSTIAEVASPVNSHNDMYVWREIFSLWLEFDIFEGTREKDRGEMSVAASESRLHKYLEALEKRGLLTPHQSIEQRGKTLAGTLDSWALQAFSPTNPLTDPRSIATLEHFLRLNVALVTIKRFERLNIETIRKLFKKHSKKTSLHIRENINRISSSSKAQQLLRAASFDSPIPELDWNHASVGDVLKSLTALAPSKFQASFQLSLPRIVSCLLTKALMPVLPSVDDYSCSVCTSIAWHPIRLCCGHLFCIRCLVKLQKQGMNECPLCRAPNAVRDADENNLDCDMMKYLQEWFPREVEEKIKENKSDRSVEQRHEKQVRRKNRWARFRTRYHPENEPQRECVIS